MEEKLTRFKTILNEVKSLNEAAAVLDWDAQTYMPKGGAESRGEQIAVIRGLTHEKSTSPELGELIESLKPYAAQLDPDSDDARLIRVINRDYQKKVRVPADLVARSAQATAIGQQIWMQAKTESNFAKFQPYLERIVELRREYAAIFAPYDHVYDPLLDDFEPGMKTAQVQKIFSALRPQQVELIHAIAEKPVIDDSFMNVSLDPKKQWDFGVDVINHFGFNWNSGRQDQAMHPFTTTFGINDVRITTRFDEKRSMSALFSTMHEAGHAMYEQGISPAFQRTPMADGASMAVHESQSRMWENLVGRSRAFWTYFFPRLQAMFPAEYGNIDLGTFYKGINKIEPSFVRVEADEGTYNLHIMLRLELEIALMEGSLAVRDLPEAWNARMSEYLGVTPPNDAAGVLQDIHWSGGLIGYFPTYALGNLLSAQLWEAIEKDIPNLSEQIRAGKFDQLLGWLREKIHRHGAKFEPMELVQRITGTTIDPAPYMRYLKTKYGEIYGL
ncbi:MAG TPA: carboxypeptidase M32 [Anaerolineaceae bacterium]|nr:carboxypeptidase M32 [Anaerolineaceae bacterium]